MKSENHFKNNWKKAATGKKNIDPDIDFRLWTNIQSSVLGILKRRRIIFSAAVIIPLLVLSIFVFFHEVEQRPEIYKSGNKVLFITLQDGSTVQMKPGSELTPDEKFGITYRDVGFSGEGVFEVKKNMKAPFRVFGEDFSTEVLGTKFVFISKKGLKKVELKEGSVRISYNGKHRVLKPLENWSVNEGGKEFVYFDKNFSLKLNVGQQSFGEVIKILESKYNYKINYPEKYKNQIVTGTVEGNLQQILSIICYPFNLESNEIIKEKEITLK